MFRERLVQPERLERPGHRGRLARQEQQAQPERLGQPDRRDLLDHKGRLGPRDQSHLEQ